MLSAPSIVAATLLCAGALSAKSDIGLFTTHQLRLLRGELREALEAVVDDRVARIHYADALERISKATGS